MPKVCTFMYCADCKMFFSGIALIFVRLLVLNLLTGAGAYIKHQRDLYALSAAYMYSLEHAHEGFIANTRSNNQ